MTTDLQIVEHHNQRLLTTAQLAAAYGTVEKYIRKNFENNKDHSVAGKHYVVLEGEELKELLSLHASFLRLQNVSKIRSLYLWTEKGAFMHAKSLNTDQAWNAYEMLVDEYYRLIHPPQAQAAPPQPACTLADVLPQRAFLNEGRVPAALFSPQGELSRELHYVEGFLNTTLDNGAYLENSVGQCFSPYARPRSSSS